MINNNYSNGIVELSADEIEQVEGAWASLAIAAVKGFVWGAGAVAAGAAALDAAGYINVM